MVKSRLTAAFDGRCDAPASLLGLSIGEVVRAPGVERSTLLETAFNTDPAAFAGRSP
jgi:hypothetical protein